MTFMPNPNQSVTNRGARFDEYSTPAYANTILYQNHLEFSGALLGVYIDKIKNSLGELVMRKSIVSSFMLNYAYFLGSLSGRTECLDETKFDLGGLQMSMKRLMSPAICLTNNLERAFISSSTTLLLGSTIPLSLRTALSTIHATHLILHNLLCSAVFLFPPAASLPAGASVSVAAFFSVLSAYRR